jgi:hypothetical protein
MNLSAADIKAIQYHSEEINKIIRMVSEPVTNKFHQDKRILKEQDYRDLLDLGARFYMGEGEYNIKDPVVTVDAEYGFVILSTEVADYECYSNGCVFKYSLPPHTEKIQIQYLTEIPNKLGYKY